MKSYFFVNIKEGKVRTRGELLKLISLFFPPPLKKKLTFTSIAERLKLTQKERKIVKKIEKLYPSFQNIIINHSSSQSSSQLFAEGKEEVVEILLLSLISSFDQKNLSGSILSLLKEFFQKSPLIFHPFKLLKGEEIIKLLGVPAGPHISYLLNKIHQAQISGEIKTKKDAIILIKNIWQKESHQ